MFVNNTGWSSPKTDALMDKAAIEPDPVKRAALYKEFQQIVVEECAITWIHELEFPTIYNNKYVDIIDSALGVLGNFDQAHMKS